MLLEFVKQKVGHVELRGRGRKGVRRRGRRERGLLKVESEWLRLRGDVERTGQQAWAGGPEGGVSRSISVTGTWVQVHLFDMGGQREYHAAHSIFLSPRQVGPGPLVVCHGVKNGVSISPLLRFQQS